MPKVDTTVGQLVDMIQRGDLRLPELQRRYVWPATRVRDLLDSLYRGYPSGTILVWETDEEVPTHDLAVQQSASVFVPKLLLDGQQRLTSLSAVTLGTPIKLKNRVKPIEIAFNLDHPEGPPTDVIEVEGDDGSSNGGQDSDESDDEPDEQNVQDRLKLRTFVVGSNALFSDPTWVRVSEVFGKKTDWQLLKGVVASPDEPKFDLYSKRLQRVRAIRDYPYVMHVLERTLSYEEVAEIFVRVNSLGMKLRGSDLALAQITAKWRNSLSLFEEFAEECEEVWFTFDLGLLVKTLVVFATGQSRFRTVSSIPLTKLTDAWEQTKTGLRFAVNFLRANAGIEDESLLSSPFLVIPVAVFGVLRGERLTDVEERDLLLWLFLANAKGHFSGSSETTLDNDIGILFRGGSPSQLIDLLRQQVGRLNFEPSDFVGRTPRNALFPAVYLALRHFGAKDWQSGLSLSLTHQGRNHFVNFHHIFPKSLLTAAGLEAGQINEIANLAFISGNLNRALGKKEPADYLPGIVEARGENVLAGQAIPLNPELWRIDKFSQFLETRRAELASVLNSYVDGVTSGGRAIVDVSDVISAGESLTVEFKATARFNTFSKSTDKKLEREVVTVLASFMNASGGNLLVGVNDAGIATGIDADIATTGRKDLDGYQQALVQLFLNELGADAASQVQVTFPVVSEIPICSLRVPSSPRPVYLADDSFYVRVGNTTRPLTHAETVTYVNQHWR